MSTFARCTSERSFSGFGLVCTPVQWLSMRTEAVTGIGSSLLFRLPDPWDRQQSDMRAFIGQPAPPQWRHGIPKYAADRPYLLRAMNRSLVPARTCRGRYVCVSCPMAIHEQRSSDGCWRLGTYGNLRRASGTIAFMNNCKQPGEGTGKFHLGFVLQLWSCIGLLLQ